MPKIRNKFVCQNCGYVSYKWIGKCPDCGKWNSFNEEVVKDVKKDKNYNYDTFAPLKLKEVQGLETARTYTGIGELDQVLGGGIVKGSVVLIGGEPGIGKSTIMLQIASILEGKNKKVLYVSGEESAYQIKLRADRLELKSLDLTILTTNVLEASLNFIDKESFEYLIIDSIQTVYSDNLNAPSGTVSQVKHITYKLVELAKLTGITVFIAGQVTKEGTIAGPKVMEHLVDTVLYFEGDYNKGFRILRSVKNRFGPTNEVGIFEMGEKGLTGISERRLYSGNNNSPGRVLTTVMEGSRIFIVEIQSLVCNTYFNFPRRNPTGFDLNRLHMLIAILEKKGGLAISSSDVYLNVAGGLKINETAADLAVLAAMISSFKEVIIPEECIFIGEISLSGQVSNVSNIESRLHEAARFGIKRVFYSGSEPDFKNLKFDKIENISDLISAI